MGHAERSEAAVAEDAEASRQATIKALLREREGYVARGLSDRVDAVDASLKDLGYEAKPAAKPSKGKPAKTTPAGDAGDKETTTSPPPPETT